MHILTHMYTFKNAVDLDVLEWKALQDTKWKKGSCRIYRDDPIYVKDNKTKIMFESILILQFLEVRFLPLHFYKRPTLVACFH